MYEPETCSCQNGAAFSGTYSSRILGPWGTRGSRICRERQADFEIMVSTVVVCRAAIIQHNANQATQLLGALDGGGMLILRTDETENGATTPLVSLKEGVEIPLVLTNDIWDDEGQWNW